MPNLLNSIGAPDFGVLFFYMTETLNFPESKSVTNADGMIDIVFSTPYKGQHNFVRLHIRTMSDIDVYTQMNTKVENLKNVSLEEVINFLGTLPQCS